MGLGEQHVHVAGHAAGHRVEYVKDLHRARQKVGQLVDHVLCLGHGRTRTRG